MTQVRKRRRRSSDEIDRILEQFDHSGLTQVAFARRRGLSISTLRFWLDRRRRHQRVVEPGFVPIALAEAGLGHGPGIELELGAKRRVYIPADIDREALRTLLPIVVAAC